MAIEEVVGEGDATETAEERVEGQPSEVTAGMLKRARWIMDNTKPGKHRKRLQRRQRITAKWGQKLLFGGLGATFLGVLAPEVTKVVNHRGMTYDEIQDAERLAERNASAGKNLRIIQAEMAKHNGIAISDFIGGRQDVTLEVLANARLATDRDGNVLCNPFNSEYVKPMPCGDLAKAREEFGERGYDSGYYEERNERILTQSDGTKIIIRPIGMDAEGDVVCYNDAGRLGPVAKCGAVIDAVESQNEQVDCLRGIDRRFNWAVYGDGNESSVNAYRNTPQGSYSLYYSFKPNAARDVERASMTFKPNTSTKLDPLASGVFACVAQYGSPNKAPSRLMNCLNRFNSNVMWWVTNDATSEGGEGIHYQSGPGLSSSRLKYDRDVTFDWKARTSYTTYTDRYSTAPYGEKVRACVVKYPIPQWTGN